MGKYQKPICECGNNLKIHMSHGIEYYYEILRNGKKAKFPIKNDTSDILEATNLICNKCGNIYAITWDNKERVVRGELIE